MGSLRLQVRCLGSACQNSIHKSTGNMHSLTRVKQVTLDSKTTSHQAQVSFSSVLIRSQSCKVAFCLATEPYDTLWFGHWHITLPSPLVAFYLATEPYDTFWFGHITLPSPLVAFCLATEPYDTFWFGHIHSFLSTHRNEHTLAN